MEGENTKAPSISRINVTQPSKVGGFQFFMAIQKQTPDAAKVKIGLMSWAYFSSALPASLVLQVTRFVCICSYKFDLKPHTQSNSINK